MRTAHRYERALLLCQGVDLGGLVAGLVGVSVGSQTCENDAGRAACLYNGTPLKLSFCGLSRTRWAAT